MEREREAVSEPEKREFVPSDFPRPSASYVDILRDTNIEMAAARNVARSIDAGDWLSLEETKANRPVVERMVSYGFAEKIGGEHYLSHSALARIYDKYGIKDKQ